MRNADADGVLSSADVTLSLAMTYWKERGSERRKGSEAAGAAFGCSGGGRKQSEEVSAALSSPASSLQSLGLCMLSWTAVLCSGARL